MKAPPPPSASTGAPAAASKASAASAYRLSALLNFAAGTSAKPWLWAVETERGRYCIRAGARASRCHVERRPSPAGERVVLSDLGKEGKGRDGRASRKPPAPAVWEDVATEVTEAVAAVIEPQVRKAADDLYARMMETVQDYLADNLRFNLSSRLESAEREGARLRKEVFDARSQRIDLADALNNLISAAAAPSLPDRLRVAH